jgi:aminoglycoside phosphotransferase (APT) family kinase protein
MMTHSVAAASMERGHEDAEIAHLLVLRGGRYAAGVRYGPVTAHLLKKQIRMASVLRWYRITSGTGSQVVLVKVPLLPGGSIGSGRAIHEVSDRPRVVQFADPLDKSRHEFNALERIDEYFRSIGDPRFSTVRAFDFLESQHAIVVEALDQPTLRTVAFYRGRRPSRAAAESVATAMAHAGAWLKTYQNMPTPTHARPLLRTRSEFVAFSEQLAGYLAERTGLHPFLTVLMSRIARRARQSMPKVPLLGMAHGDFAPRNILVGAAQQVTVLDTTARYLVPLYRDLGAFLANLSCSGVPAMGYGAIFHVKRLAQYRRRFLSGYFDSPVIPYDQLVLYEVQSLLECWASTAWATTVRHGVSSRAGVSLRASSWMFRYLIEYRLRSIGW